ncbi:MAG TPA: hypothetical protein VNH38_07970 [Candidatus Dormibacteraeota bacterium]|nr:hypothetical protein [Candidatus Dormibacteraeota bacterium]
MPAEAGDESELDPLPSAFLDQLVGEEELLVSSRDGAGQGTVRMWFAVIPPGYIYLLTPTYTKKAERWRDDPWVRFRIPGTALTQEGAVTPIGWDLAQADGELLTRSFSMAGAATPEALSWMLQDGSRQLLKAGVRRSAGSDRVAAIEPEDRR